MESLPALATAFVIVLLSLSVHEAAHAWTADKLGDPTARMLGRVSLNPVVHIDWIGTVILPLLLAIANQPVFGWAKPVPVNSNNLQSPRRDFALVAAAGPLSNILLALVGAALFTVLGPVAGATELGSVVGIAIFNLVTVNVLLAVFNMLPFPPLDGGNVLAGLAPEPIARAVEVIRPFGFLIIIVMLYSGVLSTVLRPVYNLVFRWLL